MSKQKFIIFFILLNYFIILNSQDDLLFSHTSKYTKMGVTLFEIKEKKKGGELIASAGIPHVINNRSLKKDIVQVFIKKANPRVDIIDMGIPFENKSNILLYNHKNKLYAVNELNKIKQWNGKKFLEIDWSEELEFYNQANFKQAFKSATYIFVNRKFYFINNLGDVFELHISETFHFFTYFPNYEDESLVIFGSKGEIVKIKDGIVEFIDGSKNYSDQYYSSIVHNSSVFLGHYPSGNLHQINLSSFQKTDLVPAIIKDKCSSSGEREVQSLALFGGKIIAGLWPFGELYHGLPNEEWFFFSRLFSGSNCGNAPYKKFLVSTNFVYNALGQRITDIVPFEDGIIISTASKNPSNKISDALFLLDDKKVSQYGRVYKVKKHYDFACSIAGYENSELTIEVWRKKINILIDKKLLCSNPFDITKTFIVHSKPKEMPNYGIFGKSLHH